MGICPVAIPTSFDMRRCGGLCGGAGDVEETARARGSRPIRKTEAGRRQYGGSEVDYGFGSLASVMDTRFGQQFASVVWNPFLQFEDECFWLLVSRLHFVCVRCISTGTFITIIYVP